VSEDDRLYAVVRVGRTRILIDASRVQEIGPEGDARSSGLACVDLGEALRTRLGARRQALRLAHPTAPTWVVTDPGLRLTRLGPDAMRPLPAWLGSRAPLRSIARLAPEEPFAFELDLEAVVAEARSGDD